MKTIEKMIAGKMTRLVGRLAALTAQPTTDGHWQLAEVQLNWAWRRHARINLTRFNKEYHFKSSGGEQ
jgi:hypothetical protein